MPKSPHFARIKDHVLQLTAAVPEGRICTHKSIGEYLDVMPRHVAYILSQLDDLEKIAYPWHRIVSEDGRLGTPKKNPDGMSQAALLRSEGVDVSGNRVRSAFEQVFISAERLPSGLSKQTRPMDAPSS
jgi:methylated-DNA-protein-cysteine methyltransferase-like protein